MEVENLATQLSEHRQELGLRKHSASKRINSGEELHIISNEGIQTLNTEEGLMDRLIDSSSAK